MKKEQQDEVKKCIICGFDRAVDRAHLIPRRITSTVAGMAHLSDFDDNNYVFLCKNHHFLFDHDRLTDEEWIIVFKRFGQILNELLEILFSDYGIRKGISKKKGVPSLKALDKWRKRITDRVVRYKKYEKCQKCP